MSFDPRQGGIDRYAVQHIRFTARQLAGQAGFGASERKDLEQELFLDLLTRLPQYDPERGRRTTFISRVVANRVSTLIESQKAGLRDYRLRGGSLNERLEDEEGRTVERLDTLDGEDHLLRTGAVSRPWEERQALAMDLAALMETLPPEWAMLCRRLRVETVSEISRDTGIARGTIYEWMGKLRGIFEEAGLREYLD